MVWGLVLRVVCTETNDYGLPFIVRVSIGWVWMTVSQVGSNSRCMVCEHVLGRDTGI